MKTEGLRLVSSLTSVFNLQGFLEQTYLFYGFYKVDKIHFPNISYNLPLAYLLVTIAYLFLSLVWIVKRYRKIKSGVFQFRTSLHLYVPLSLSLNLTG